MPVIIPISGIVGIEVLASQIREKINAANGDDIIFQVNSAGGFVFEGFEIFNLIKNAKNKTTAHLMGITASIASYLVLAADEIIAEENAVFMIHNAYSLSIGDHNDLRKTADRLEQSSTLLANAYSARTGKDVSEITSMMNAETFIYGKDIVAQGFADSSFEDENQEAKGEESAMAFAKQQIEYCSSEMKANKMASEDLEKAAAYLKGMTQNASSVKPVVKIENLDPTPEPQNNQEEPMEFEEFLSKNPEAKAKYDADMKASKESGLTEQQAVFAKVEKFLAHDSKYGKSIAELAMKAVKGEVSADSVLSAVAAVDSFAEQQNSSDAADDSDDAGNTPPEGGGDQASADGVIRNKVDEIATIEKLKQR